MFHFVILDEDPTQLMPSDMMEEVVTPAYNMIHRVQFQMLGVLPEDLMALVPKKYYALDSIMGVKVLPILENDQVPMVAIKTNTPNMEWSGSYVDG